MATCCRTIRDVLVVLANNRVKTLSKLQKCKFNDLTIPNDALGALTCVLQQAVPSSTIFVLFAGATRSFLRQLTKKSKEPREEADDHGECGSTGALSRAVLEALQPKKPETVSVNLEEKMGEAGLSNLFPVDAWPAAHAVNEMATRCSRQEKRKMAVTFQAVQLRKCVVLFHC